MAVTELTALDRLIKGERVEVETTPLDSMLQEVKQQMQAAVNALVDTAAQTGMRQWGKVVGGGSAKKEKGPVDLDTIVARLRTSLPVMRAAQIDSSLRRLLLS
jgi:hypothetical protein